MRARAGVFVLLISFATGSLALAQPTAPAAPARPAPRPVHPLDPLTAAEITTAVQVLRTHPEMPATAVFPVVSLHEPSKDVVRAFGPGVQAPRSAFVVVLDRPASRTYEAIVDLRTKRVADWRHMPGAQPALTFEEFDAVPALVRKNPEWLAAMKRRGITNVEDVAIDSWAPGPLDPKTEPRTTRWIRALAYLKGKQKNPYARPIEGVVALVNLTQMRVERVLDTGVRPLPTETADLDERAIGKLRVGPKPLVYSQPLGPSFELRGHEVRWQNWRFRVSIHPREGLVIHTVGYQDQGRVRPVLHRASLSEMLVPYSDPAENWSFRNAFDEGEYGIGRLTQPMEIGTDAPAHARFLDAEYADDFGKPQRIRRAVAIYERDGGLLWKHFEYHSGSSESRRARDLVVSSLVTVGNYDYGTNWIFRQDGSLELQVVLTGILLAKGIDRAAPDAGHDGAARVWHRVGLDVAAPHHQHFFNFRLDFDVDGATPNAVREWNTRAMPPGPANPGRNAFVMEEATLASEAAARRDLNLASARKWAVMNPSSTNALGQHAAYLLIPGESGVPYLDPDTAIRRRAGFINHHFWATRFHEAEWHAAGAYPNQSEPGEGLPAWTRADWPLEGQDVVVWYTFGITHVPRPEEWPVMTAHTAGFKLVPAGFFAKNPALDVPKK